MKNQIYSFGMVESKAIIKQLAQFNKIFDDLVNIEVNIKDEDNDLLLLCALLRYFDQFEDTMIYGNEGIVN